MAQWLTRKKLTNGQQVRRCADWFAHCAASLRDYAKAASSSKGKAALASEQPQSSKYSLGWIPFKAERCGTRRDNLFAGQRLSLWDSYGLADYELRAGSFSPTARVAGT